MVRLAEDPQKIAELLGFQERASHKAIRKKVPLSKIITLPQPRKTFEEIPDIGGSILQINLIYLPVLAHFNRPDFEKYLRILSALWRSPLSIKDYLHMGILDPEKEEISYYILLDGERRIRGCRWYLGHSCEDHPDVEGCYRLHFGSEDVEATLMIGITPLNALFLQSAANSHNRVPAHEDAKFIDNLFRMVRICNPQFPLSKFAKLVGRGTEAVRNAVRFCFLPSEVQAMVPEKISYGIACEVSRLQEIGLPDGELKSWANMAVLSRQKVPDFRKLVIEFIRQQQNGQTSLFDIFSERQIQQMKRLNRRLVVAKHSVAGLWDFISYFGLVLRMFEDGDLGKEDSPFSEGSPLRIFRALIEKERRLLPHLEGLMPSWAFFEAQEVIEKAKKIALRLEAVLPN